MAGRPYGDGSGGGIIGPGQGGSGAYGGVPTTSYSPVGGAGGGGGVGSGGPAGRADDPWLNVPLSYSSGAVGHGNSLPGGMGGGGGGGGNAHGGGGGGGGHHGGGYYGTTPGGGGGCGGGSGGGGGSGMRQTPPKGVGPFFASDGNGGGGQPLDGQAGGISFLTGAVANRGGGGGSGHDGGGGLGVGPPNEGATASSPGRATGPAYGTTSGGGGGGGGGGGVMYRPPMGVGGHHHATGGWQQGAPPMHTTYMGGGAPAAAGYGSQHHGGGGFPGTTGGRHPYQDAGMYHPLQGAGGIGAGGDASSGPQQSMYGLPDGHAATGGGAGNGHTPQAGLPGGLFHQGIAATASPLSPLPYATAGDGNTGGAAFLAADGSGAGRPAGAAGDAGGGGPKAGGAPPLTAAAAAAEAAAAAAAGGAAKSPAGDAAAAAASAAAADAAGRDPYGPRRTGAFKPVTDKELRRKRHNQHTKQSRQKIDSKIRELGIALGVGSTQKAVVLVFAYRFVKSVQQGMRERAAAEAAAGASGDAGQGAAAGAAGRPMGPGLAPPPPGEGLGMASSGGGGGGGGVGTGLGEPLPPLGMGGRLGHPLGGAGGDD